MPQKEFVAYKFEEVNEDELKLGEFMWTPVLFPYHPDRNLYFITLHVSGDEGCFDFNVRKGLRDDISRTEEFVINSIYDVCGYNPLFLIVEAKSPDDIKSVITKNTYPRYMSFTTPANIIKRFGKNSDEFREMGDRLRENPNLLRRLEEGIGRITESGRLCSREEVEREFKGIENWEEFVRFVPMNMDKVISILLIQPPDDEAEREVIKVIKKDERIIDAYTVIGGSKYLIKVITKDINEVFEFVEFFMRYKTHTSSKIVLCTPKENGVPFRDGGPPTPKLTTALSPIQRNILRYLWKAYEKFILDREAHIDGFCEEHPEWADRDELRRQFEFVEKEFVYKCSTKLDRRGWFKTLLFIKTSLGGRKIVWDGIINNLLDVDYTYFLRKHYAVTGDFDFIVPMDFYLMQTLKNKITKFQNAEVGRGDERVEKYVTDIRIYFEESSGMPKKWEGLRPFEIAGIKAMLPNSRMASGTRIEKGEKIPRETYHEFFSRGHERPKDLSLTDILQLAKAKPTIELHSEKLVHAFVRFKIKDRANFDRVLKELKTDENYLFLWREYAPVQNPCNKMYIVITENFYSLLLFIASLDKYSRETITSLIFTQEFYRPKIQEKLRCKPCRLPVGEKCDACPQYIKPRRRIDVRDVNLKIEGIKPCKIAVVQLKMEDLHPLLPWYNREDREEIMEEQKKKVIEKLDEAIKGNADIVVFPEMSVPKALVEEIKGRINGCKIIVIAGTHLYQYRDDVCLEDGIEKRKYYNTCPVLISDGKGEVKRYDVHRNALSHRGDKRIENKYKDIKIEEGCGMLRFINTGFGDFSILICYDFFEANMFDALSQKIDFLIVPSWNPATDRAEAKAVITTVKGKRWFTILANNGIYGKSGLYPPYRMDGRALEESNRRIMGSGIANMEYYQFDVLELDRARDRTVWERNEGDLGEEEKKIRNKYEGLDADASIEPRHRELWKNGGN